MNIKDAFGNEIKDKDCVVIIKCDKPILGIYNNCQVLTCSGRVNINQVHNIIKLNCVEINAGMKEVLSNLKQHYANELKNAGVVPINELEAGQIVETKSGIKWLVLGENWRICHSGDYTCTKTGRMYIKAEHINLSKSLRENLDELLSKCKNITDFNEYFKFSNVKASRVIAKVYSEKDIDEFISKGKIGIALNKKEAIFLYNRNTKYNKVYYGINNVTYCGSSMGIFKSTENIDRLVKVY